MKALSYIHARLAGKKTSIATIAGLGIVFLQGRGYIAADTAYLLQGTLVALGLSANYASFKQAKAQDNI